MSKICPLRRVMGETEAKEINEDILFFILFYYFATQNKLQVE